MKRLIDDELWALVQPLLPPHAPHPKGGRPFVDDRAALTGIVFVLRSGIPWEMLPHELGCGSGVTCWRRLRDWQAAGVWDRLHQLLLGRLAQAGKLDWRRACLDSRSLAAKRGQDTSPNPTDRARPGSKHHVLVDANGIPLATRVSAANRNDSKLLEPMLDAVVPVRTHQPGRPRRRPDKLHADKGYDHAFCRKACRRRGVAPRIARRGKEASQRLGRHRWVVERTLAWLARFRCLTIRYERRADIHQGFLSQACTLICQQCLRRL